MGDSICHSSRCVNHLRASPPLTSRPKRRAIRRRLCLCGSDSAGAHERVEIERAGLKKWIPRPVDEAGQARAGR